MDEKKTDPSGYEPNFVMKDAAESEAAENQPDMAENQSDMPEDPAKAAAPPGDDQPRHTAAAPSPMASRTSKGMAARANSTRHMKYRVTLVRRILVSFLFKGVPSLRHTDPLYNS